MLRSPDDYQPPPSPPIVAPSDGESPASDETGSAAELLDEDHYYCLYCHTLRGEGDDSGAGAPALDEGGKGWTAEWLHELLQDPEARFPGSGMPTAEDLGMTASDRETLVEFLLGLDDR